MAFGNEIKTSNIQENWLFELTYNSGVIYLSFADYNDGSNFYYGSILNRPSIRETLQLSNSTAKTSNISIDVANFTYQGSPFSEFLFGGSNYFINQQMIVKSVVNYATANIIGYFRVTDISLNEQSIKIDTIAHRPWDFVDIPNVKTAQNRYVPVVYGDYTKNTNTQYNSSDLTDAEFITSLTNDTYFPAEYHISRAGKEEFTTGIHSIGSNAEAAHYDSALDTFIPFTDPSSANVVRTTNHYITKAKRHFVRGFGHRPDGFTDHHSKWSNEENAYNTNTTDFAQYEQTFTASSSTPSVLEANTANDLDYTFQIPTGTLNQGTMVIELQTQHTVGSNFNSSADTFSVKTYIDYTGTGDSFTEVLVQDHTDGDNSTDNHTITKTFTADDRHPDVIKFGIRRQIVDATGAGTNPISGAVVRVRIKDIKMFPEMLNEEKDGLKGYCAGDGLTNSWDSSAITEIHEAHRDLLIRFAGMVTTTPTNWSTLDSTKDWEIKYWQTKLEPLTKVLERLQYEGGFIFKFKRGNLAEPEYVYIKDSYSSGDIDYTITKADINNTQVNITSFSNLVTQMNVNYQLHPTGSRYKKTITAKSDTTRTNYNIQTKENIIDVNLDAYTAPDVDAYDNSTDVESANPNDDFFAYYHNLNGSPRILVSGKIINPALYNIDTGDLVSFSDMHPAKAFGKAYTNVVFMITKLSRSPGILQFEAREIGAIS
jgi:hypothetical protein